MPTYVNDANDFIKKVKDLSVPKYSTLVSINVKTLCTNIPDAEACQACTGVRLAHQKY